MKKYLVAALLLAATPAAASPPPSWLELRQGTKAYTGDDHESENTLTVCPTANSYKTWSASITAVVPACRERPSGVPVTIASDEIIPSRIGDYIVFIKSNDGSWSGWTGSAWLQPQIPAGTKVVVKMHGGENWLLPNRTSVAGHIVLTDGTTLQILAQDPKSGNHADLYAQIISDLRDAGKKGWLHRLDGWDLNVEGVWHLSFVPPNGAPPPTAAAAAAPKSDSGGRIVNKPVWACPSIDVLKKLTRVATETDPKDRTYLSLKAHFDWGCELFVEGDEVFITDVSGPFSQVHHKADTRDFWTLSSLLD